MSQEPNRAAMAALDGWTFHIHPEPEDDLDDRLDAMIRVSPGDVIWMSPEGHYVRDCPPDYSKDLNALNLVVRRKIIQKGKAKEFAMELYKVINRNASTHMSDYIDDPVEIAGIISNATAPEVFEAALRTLGLFVEEEPL